MTRKSYPQKCPNCCEPALFAAVQDTVIEMHHDGVPYSVTVSNSGVSRCTTCGDCTFSYDATGRIEDALRVAVGILMPHDILAARLRLGVTPEELAEQLGVPEAVYARWEDGGQLQSRAFDKLLRLYFANPDGFRHNVTWPHAPAAISAVS